MAGLPRAYVEEVKKISHWEEKSMREFEENKARAKSIRIKHSVDTTSSEYEIQNTETSTRIYTVVRRALTTHAQEDFALLTASCDVTWIRARLDQG